MILSYKTLLITSCIPLSLYSMDAPTNINKQPASIQCQPKPLTKNNIVDIGNLYKQTYNKFEDLSPTNNSRELNVLEILSRTNHLKEQGITERHIGEFAFKQQADLLDQVRLYGKPPYNGPLYICVFFERLRQYNKNLEKNGFINPTTEQLDAYKKNEAKKATIEDAASFRLFLDSNTLNKEKNIFHDIPLAAATKAFSDLIADTYAILHKSSEYIETLATILYGPAKENKS